MQKITEIFGQIKKKQYLCMLFRALRYMRTLKAD